ncbi:MAG: anthranilate synthase component I family protein [Planctomycetaceae bacterium]|nr:anthranilate synthase component I family protein [Planctomycetaceae bacterium]
MLTQEQYIEQAKQYTVVPVAAKLLADRHTPVTLLQRFYKENTDNGQEGVFLLESVEGGEKWGRYSFVGIDAHAFIEIWEETVEIRECTGGDHSIRHNGKPLEVLREWMQDYRVAEQPELPRFFGGLVGYFAYEMVSFFEKIPHRLEDEPLGAFVIPKTILILDNLKQVLTVCITTFPGEEKPSEYATLYRSAVQEIERIAAELEKPLDVALSKLETDVTLTPVMPEKEYRKKVETIKEHIRNGDIIQCVFSQPFVADEAPDAVSLYRALRFSNPAPYLFFMHLSGTVLVGSSPETMIRLEGRSATLRPIAGTRKRGTTEQQDRELADEMLRDPKEKAEHLMLVDLGRNDLGRVAKTGTVQVTDLMFVERHPHVMHLVSNVTAELDDGHDGFDLFRATFPAGTLSGAPKVRAMQIIAEQETTPRGPYGGAAGYIAFGGNIDFAITIRTATIREGKLTARAGGGIVHDSIPENERLETVNKAKAIAGALEMLGQIDIHTKGEK